MPLRKIINLKMLKIMIKLVFRNIKECLVTEINGKLRLTLKIKNIILEHFKIKDSQALFQILQKFKINQSIHMLTGNSKNMIFWPFYLNKTS